MVHLRLGNFHHRKGSNTMKRGQHPKYRCPRHPPWKRRSHGGVSTMNGGVRGVEIHPVSSVSKTWCLSHPAVHSHGIHPGELHMQIIFPWQGHHCVCLKRFRGFHMSSTTAKVQSKCACISNIRMTMVITSQHQSFAKFLAASIAKLAPMSKPHLGGQWRPWVQAHLYSCWIACSVIS